MFLGDVVPPLRSPTSSCRSTQSVLAWKFSGRRPGADVYDDPGALSLGQLEPAPLDPWVRPAWVDGMGDAKASVGKLFTGSVCAEVAMRRSAGTNTCVDVETRTSRSPVPNGAYEKKLPNECLERRILCHVDVMGGCPFGQAWAHSVRDRLAVNDRYRKTVMVDPISRPVIARHAANCSTVSGRLPSISRPARMVILLFRVTYPAGGSRP